MHFILECIHSAVPMVPEWLLNLRVIYFHICINDLVNLLPFCRALKLMLFLGMATFLHGVQPKNLVESVKHSLFRINA